MPYANKDANQPAHPRCLISVFAFRFLDSIIPIIRKIAVYFLWLSLPDDYRVTDEALLAETT